MDLHPTYAVTPAREPAGHPGRLDVGTREKDASGMRDGPKESALDRGLRTIGGNSAASARHASGLCGRPGGRHHKLGTPVDWLVRAKHNRALEEDEKLWTHTYEGQPNNEKGARKRLFVILKDLRKA